MDLQQKSKQRWLPHVDAVLTAAGHEKTGDISALSPCIRRRLRLLRYARRAESFVTYDWTIWLYCVCFHRRLLLAESGAGRVGVHGKSKHW